ncbi:MAG: DUF3151 domain-containing protein [Candidatus Nanopelagicales bacterium]
MNLLNPADPTLLPVNADLQKAIESLPPMELPIKFPDQPLAWAIAAEAAWKSGQVLGSYAYARVGYHRALDQLRKSGWKGAGPVPYAHEGNRGFLWCLAALGRAAKEIGEEAEVYRLANFISECTGTEHNLDLSWVS